MDKAFFPPRKENLLLAVIMMAAALPSFCAAKDVTPSDPIRGWMSEENGSHRAKSRGIREDFYRHRAELLRKEADSFMGAELVLDEEERVVNTHLMERKHMELSVAFNRSYFPPSQSLFVSRDDIEQSKVFDGPAHQGMEF